MLLSRSRQDQQARHSAWEWKRPSRVATLAIASTWILATGALAAEASLLERFRAEYPAASKLWLKQTRHLVGERTLRYDDPITGKRKSTAKFARSDGLLKLTGSAPGPGGNKTRLELVACNDGTKEFIVLRQSPDEPYILADIIGLNDPRSSLQTELTEFLEFPFLVEGQPIADLISDDKITNLTTREIQWKGAPAVELGFHVPKENNAHTYTLILDPAQGWAVVNTRRRSSADPSSRVEAQLDYQHLENGIFFPTTIEYRQNSMTIICRFNNLTVVPTPREQFTLAFYGLPDVSRPDRTRNWILKGLLLLAGALFLFVVLWRRLRRKP